ncbi:cobalamin-dependent protein [Nisaea acidiphila]|uniref:Cobalamin-dependent protein n=1 Tax=Nisaea acidiphila TaxID=1862145 RepID=A0A9J7AMC5_9PROT|nr:cobalamin-dependent protein [Nisaea acidiphila]UUX48795.1 cobalamin-dependent protein [Nisaea acidiphila]
MLPDRATIFPEPDLPNGAGLLAEGATLARHWTVGPSAFLKETGAASEHAYKLRRMAEGAVMQHAQIGYRDPGKSIRAYREIWEACQRRGITIDRYGLCLDWSMALPKAIREKATRGTGMILESVEDFAALANAAPVAAHFGDFVLGFPAAVENTQAALAAGSTAIGNLGQYFTFRIPGHDDDIAATRETVRALGLIAAQPVPVLVHSNIDDGFGAHLTDLASCLGMMLIEQEIGRLAGVPVAHCYGHHFSDPLARLAFQRAMALAEMVPGSMVYGNTTSYRGTPAENAASLSSYLMVDALGQATRPTGHAINPVPVTENERIPEIDEVIEAQLHAGRLKEHALDWEPLIAGEGADAMAATLLDGARRFERGVMKGLAEAGIDTSDVFEMLLALRRIGARKLEAAYGPGAEDAAAFGGRVPLVPATIVSEIAGTAGEALSEMSGEVRDRLKGSGLKVLVAAGDVHEHGKMVVEELVRRLGLDALDGGVSTDPEILAARAGENRPDAIAISTYNGVALGYYRSLKAALAEQGLDIPVLMGGRLNQIPETSNSSLPVDVGAELAEEGALLCRSAAEMGPALAALLLTRGQAPQ